MKPKLHIFNPGHETAVLQGTSNYTPPANVRQMSEDLAYLPIWYAEAGDFVFTGRQNAPHFIDNLPIPQKPFGQPISTDEILRQGEQLPPADVFPWGLSPQSIHFFEQVAQKSKWDLTIPEWNDAYTLLTSRQTAAVCLDKIKRLLPEYTFPATPVFCKSVRDIEHYLRKQSCRSLIKTPFSSSGRGLQWLQSYQLTEKDCLWIEGALKRQGCVSIEPVIENKQTDFAMEFYSDGKGTLTYKGLSVFDTKARGAYASNRIASQQSMERDFLQIFEEAFLIVKEAVLEAVRQTYGSIYTGYIGVDMMSYQDSGGHMLIHPCIEVNLRYTMGMLAIRLFENFVHPDASGKLLFCYSNHPDATWQQKQEMEHLHPIVLADGCIRKGTLSLCPVEDETQYSVYLTVD